MAWAGETVKLATLAGRPHPVTRIATASSLASYYIWRQDLTTRQLHVEPHWKGLLKCVITVSFVI